MFMPVSGEVTEANPLLESNPETLNKDPYGDGWVIKIKLSDPAETAVLLTADQYKQLVNG